MVLGVVCVQNADAMKVKCLGVCAHTHLCVCLGMCLHVSLCVGLCMGGHMFVCTCVYVHMRPEVDNSCLPQLYSNLYLETECLTELSSI